MSQINSVGNSNPVQKIVTQPVQKSVGADAPKQLRVTDRVELSGVSHLLNSLKTNDIRADKVAEVKSQIDAGTYENDAKLDAAIERMLDDVLE